MSDANTDRPALSPPAVGGVSVSEAAKAQIVGWESVRGFDMPVATHATPTPAPADHIGDATEKVDWEQVGPKLVEALGELVAAMRRYEVDVDADAPYSHVEMMQRADAALAATQPEGK